MTMNIFDTFDKIINNFFGECELFKDCPKHDDKDDFHPTFKVESQQTYDGGTIYFVVRCEDNEVIKAFASDYDYEAGVKALELCNILNKE